MPRTLFFIIIGIIISSIILIYGYISCRNLSANVRRLSWGRFALISIIPLMFCLYLGRPHISSFSKVEILSELKVDNLNPDENIVNFEKEKINQIEYLKKEVTKLREDLVKVNDYYDFLFIIIFNILVQGSIMSVFIISKKIKENKNKI